MKRKIVYVLSAVCLLSVIAMILSLTLFNGKTEQPKFIPPDFESESISGFPETDDESFTKIYKDGMSFSAHICGNLKLDGEFANVYFANDPENDVWLKLRIFDESGDIIGETGILKPNEYVKSVRLLKIPAKGEKIKLKIMAYEPNTYLSEGAVTLNTTVK